MVNLIFFFYFLTNIFFLILILLNPNNPNPTDDIRSRHSAVVIPVPVPVAVPVAVPVSVIPAFAIFAAAPVIPAAVNLDVIHATVTIAALVQIAM